MKMLARWKEGLFWRSESVTPWWIIPVAETDWPTRTGKPSVPTGALLLRVRTRYRIGKQYQKDLALASWQKGGSSKPAWVVELSETEHGKYFREGIGSRGRLPASLYMVVSSTRFSLCVVQGATLCVLTQPRHPLIVLLAVIVSALQRSEPHVVYRSLPLDFCADARGFSPRWTWASFISHFLSPRRFSKRPAAMPSAMRRWPPPIVM